MKHLQYILMMTVIALLTACSQDVVEEQTGVPSQEPDASIRLAGFTRALTGGTEGGSIRVFLTNGTTATEGLFKYEGGASWTTQLKLKSGARTYQLYGYMPDNTDFVRSISDWDDNSAVLHIQQMPLIDEQDFCIVTGVRKAENKDDETDAVRGAFSFKYDSRQDNYINLFLDHLYSHVIFNMKVGEEYNTVRTIRIKSMKLKVADGSLYDVDVTLTKNVGISSVAYGTGTAVTGTREVTMRDEELTLTTAYTTVCSGYVMPATTPANTQFDKLSLVIEYDIYDKKGSKIAERTATNSLARPLDELMRGEERTLQINIDPSYLYDLSQNDPPIVVIRS